MIMLTGLGAAAGQPVGVEVRQDWARQARVGGAGVAGRAITEDRSIAERAQPHLTERRTNWVRGRHHGRAERRSTAWRTAQIGGACLEEFQPS
jgi:hypothetical protein